MGSRGNDGGELGDERVTKFRVEMRGGNVGEVG